MKYVCPPLGLNVTVTLVFDLETKTKFNRCHLLIKTNHYTQLKDPRAMGSLVIDRTRFVYVRTDRQTDNQLTDRHVQSNISPLLRRGGT